MNTPTTARRRERKDVRRNMERVLQAAHDLFAERGADVTMEEVARRAGVGVGTIYRRFPSKDDLFAAVSNAVCADTRHYLHEAVEDAHDPLGKLHAIVVVHYRHVERKSVLLDMRPDPAADAHSCGLSLEQQGLYRALHEMLQHIIIEGQRQGTIRQGDPAVLAALCLELLNPRTFQNLQRVIGGDAADVAEHVVRFVRNGLEALPLP